MMWWNGITLYTLVSMCLTASAFRIEPPLPLTVAVNQIQTFTLFTTDGDKDIPPDFDLQAIPVTSTSQSSKENNNEDDFVGFGITASANFSFPPFERLRGGGDGGDSKKAKSRIATVTFPNATPFLIVAVGGKPGLGQKPFATMSGTVAVHIVITNDSSQAPPTSQTPTGQTQTSQTQPTSSSSTPRSITLPDPDSGSVSSTGNGSTQTTTPETSIDPTTATPTSSSSPILPSSPLSTTAKPGENNEALIIGCAVGASIFISVCLLLLYFIYRRRQRKSRSRDTLSRSSSMVFYRDEMVRAIARRLTFRKEHPTEESWWSTPTTTLTGTFKEKQDRNSMSLAGLDALGKHDRLAPTEPKDAFWARTDRQMQVEQKIIEWQSQLTTASIIEKDLIRERVQKLEELKNSDWAYGRDGAEVPEAMRG